jgi:hypothetical protein
MLKTQKTPSFNHLTRPQIELLEMFAVTQQTESDWDEIKDMISQFLAAKVKESARMIWEANAWTNADMERFLHTHERRSDGT